MNTLRIAIDLMGGDIGVNATLPAVTSLAKKHSDIQFHVYGETSVAEQISILPFNNIVFTATENSVAMDDKPVFALRHKRSSSMAAMLSAVADNRADGCISAGNTGALVALAMHYLPRFEGVERPAFCQTMPVVGQSNSDSIQSSSRKTYMLDLGANTDCSAEQLYQFSALATALSQVLDKKSFPSVRLLNIGGESFKGGHVIQAAAELLKQAKGINYQGFIEADQIYQGVCDVIVCDGLVGNVALKASEGVSRVVSQSAKSVFSANCYHRMVAWLAAPMLKEWQHQVNPDGYNGAYLLGLKGTVVKSHGSANTEQFICATEMLIHQLQQQSIYSMGARLLEILRPEATPSSI